MTISLGDESLQLSIQYLCESLQIFLLLLLVLLLSRFGPHATNSSEFSVLVEAGSLNASFKTKEKKKIFFVFLEVAFFLSANLTGSIMVKDDAIWECSPGFKTSFRGSDRPIISVETPNIPILRHI